MLTQKFLSSRLRRSQKIKLLEERLFVGREERLSIRASVMAGAVLTYRAISGIFATSPNGASPGGVGGFRVSTIQSNGIFSAILCSLTALSKLFPALILLPPLAHLRRGGADRHDV